MSELHLFYAKRFTYYNLLSKNERRKFLIRVLYIKKRKELKISVEISNPKHEIELLVFAAFIQITFGFSDYEIDKFASIIIRPSSFHSKLVNKQVKGLTVGSGFIFYSWEDFIRGYSNDYDKVNLALHELAHALYVERFHTVYNVRWEKWKKLATSEMEKAADHSDTQFFRPYGK